MTIHEPPHPAWYALVCRPRHEKAVATALGMKELECFVPLYRAMHRWSDRQKELQLPLFPGYAFCRFDVDRKIQVVSTPGVRSVVGNGRMPLPIDDAEIEHLQTVVGSGLQVNPCAFLQAGDKARVECGPLRGVEGVVVRVKNRDRMVVSVTLLQRSVSVEVDRDWLSTLSSPALELPRHLTATACG
jgi:transcription antitermination factor NusG